MAERSGDVREDLRRKKRAGPASATVREPSSVRGATDRLRQVLSQRTHSSVELAQLVVNWMTTFVPESRSLVIALSESGGASVLAADIALKLVQPTISSAAARGIVRRTLETPEITYASFDDFRLEPRWYAEVSERRSRAACLGVPRVASSAAVCVFHAPDSQQLVENTLQSLAKLLAGPEAAPPDSAVYLVISKAKREWERTVDALDQLVLLLDRKGEVLRANRAVERWGFGSVGDVRGATVHEVLHPLCKELSCRLARLLSCRWKQVRADGPTSLELYDPQLEKALQLTLQPIGPCEGPADLGDASFGVVVVKDVTELHQARRKLEELNDELELRVKKRTQQLQASNRGLRDEVARRGVAERALQESRDELARLSEQLIDTQECERRRIALELHDSVGQSLGALKYSLERYVAIRNDAALGDANSVLEASIKQLQRAINDTRSIAMSLRPSLLDDMGAVSAVKWLCRWFGDTYVEIHVIADCNVTDTEIPERLAAPVFRIIQEALTNVAKHSSARNVLVSLRRSGEVVALEVRDDGIGFDRGDGERPAVQRLGIIGMRERATMTGGKFSLVSGADVGTQIRVTWDRTKKVAGAVDPTNEAS